MVHDTKSIFGRYVDEFFGVDLPNLQWTTAKMFSVLCTYVGAPCDPAKAAYDMSQVALLGAQGFIDFAKWSYSNRILLDKAKKWAN